MALTVKTCVDSESGGIFESSVPLTTCVKTGLSLEGKSALRCQKYLELASELLRRLNLVDRPNSNYTSSILELADILFRR